MPVTFQKPHTEKRGADTAYVFHIGTDQHLTAETENVMAACGQNPLYLNTLLTAFLESCSTYFKNKTTVPNLLKALKHEVHPTASESITAPYTFTPLDIIVCKGITTVSWSITGELIQLDFPVETDQEELAIQLTDADQIPFAELNEVIHVTPSVSAQNRTELDRTRVKEAQLRAKLAVYKANRAHLEYVEKYGQEPSDSEEDEEDDDEDDSESDSE
jgi:hypothetical protein